MILLGLLPLGKILKMNKILIVDNKINLLDIDKKIKITCDDDIATKLSSINIKVVEDTDLEISFDALETKLKVSIDVLPNVKFNLFEKKTGKKNKSQYKITLNKNSYLNYNRFFDCENSKEMIIINLNGEHAKADFIHKTISTNKEYYDILVYHNAKETISNITNNGINIKDGVLHFNVSSFVPNKIKNCIVEQNSRIINLTNNECLINPNLFIDENDVIANHSALIGGYNDEELFYIKSRGIDEKTATNLLARGFLLQNLNISNDNINAINEIINKYWR